MIVIQGRNVNKLYAVGLNEIVENGEPGQSRNGPVIAYGCPVTSVYDRPTERVLFSESRDANPFFHLMEAIWMLAGRRDAAFLTRYAKQLGAYAEADGNIYGAYGHRWRRSLGYDQLPVVIEKLKKNPDDRQAVMQMWDGMYAIPGKNDLQARVRDRPCNTHIYLRVRQQKAPRVDGAPFFSSLSGPVLDLTVCCRSNDAIWGAYGANAVHFSVLQEYLAAAIGVGVGRMYQVSNNLHVYDNELLRRCVDGIEDADITDKICPYALGHVQPMPMVTHPETFLRECEQLCERIDEAWNTPVDHVVPHPDHFQNSFLLQTAWTMSGAHYWHKHGYPARAREWCAKIAADDWRLACAQWIQRRVK